MEVMYDNFFEGKAVLITGGAGFIGSHLTQHLTLLGAQVRVLDNLSTGYRKNLDGIAVSLFEGSILDASALHEAINGCSLVFHEAAFVSVPESFDNADSCFATNIKGTSNVMKAAERANCDRVMFASSAACYGSSPELPSSETDTVSAESPYAQSKVMGEQLMKDAQVDAVSLRYFNVFGERQDPDSQYAAVVSSFARTIQDGGTPTIYGNGSQTRDFTPVENIVHANLLAASHPNPLRGDVFNVGTGSSTSLLELVRGMAGNEEVTFEPARTGDVQDSRADIEKITAALSYETVVQTSDALRALVNRTRC
ncbi:MAG: UDP-glucose 4-epimerase [Phycisphaerales bacterium]|jgi:UDP-glucose 4-epimerase